MGETPSSVTVTAAASRPWHHPTRAWPTRAGVSAASGSAASPEVVLSTCYSVRFVAVRSGHTSRSSYPEQACFAAFITVFQAGAPGTAPWLNAVIDTDWCSLSHHCADGGLRRCRRRSTRRALVAYRLQRDSCVMTNLAAGSPLHVDPANVPVLNHLDFLCRVVVAGEATGGSFSLVEERGRRG